MTVVSFDCVNNLELLQISVSASPIVNSCQLYGLHVDHAISSAKMAILAPNNDPFSTVSSSGPYQNILKLIDTSWVFYMGEGSSTVDLGVSIRALGQALKLLSLSIFSSAQDNLSCGHVQTVAH